MTKRQKEQEILERFDIFKGFIQEARETTSESWMTHKVVFPKEEDLPKDPMSRKEEEYTSFDPLKHKPSILNESETDINEHAKKLRAFKKVGEW